MTDYKNSDWATTLLNNLLAHVAILDSDGNIVETNKAWQSFNKKTIQIKRPPVGSNYFRVLQHAIELGNDYALKFLLGLKNVLKGKKDSFSLTYPVTSKTDSFWFKLTVRPCDNDDIHYVMIHEDISASMKAKYQKEEHKNRFRVKFEQSLDGILITDDKGNIIETNPMASSLLGWSREELLEFSLDDLINKECNTFNQALNEQKKTGTFTIEIDFINKKGIKIPTQTASCIYRNPNGKLCSIVTFHDISRRKKIEKDLVKTREFTESALNSIPGVFFVMDQEGNMVRWNENLVTKLGYSAEELASSNAIDFVVEENIEITQNNIQRCIKEGEISITTRLYGKEGEIKDYSIFAKRFVEDGNVFIVATGIDITEKKKIERENRRHQRMLEQLFDNSPVGLTIVDNDNNIQKINSSFTEIFGYRQDEVMGKNIVSLLAPDDRFEETQSISAAMHNGKSLQIESIRINKNGDGIPVLIAGIPVKLQDETIAIYGMYVDVSTQHNYRNKLKNALREKEALLAELHHRVKNNLALISSQVEMQLFDSDNSELNHELQNIKNRIMTIASIHEVMYKNGNLTSIPFNNFIDQLVNTEMLQLHDHFENVTINIPDQDLLLDINQSIPGALLITEILSLISDHTDPEKDAKMNINLREYGSKVHIIIEGDNIMKSPAEARKKNSLCNILIDTLAMQLNGTVVWPNIDGDYQKFEIFFTKEDNSGPASEFLEVAG